jgi:pimeloyl-ACP methyl ester carboxylesterase
MSDIPQQSRWRDPALGPALELELPGARIRYHDVGEGPVLVFVHGFLVNANLWRKVVSDLRSDYRCVVLDLPLAAHSLPLAPDAANGPLEVAGMVADAIEALDLEDVTLLGSDSGGAICQVVVTTRPDRITRLVLASTDYRDNFPPREFAYFTLLGSVPGLFWLAAQSLRIRRARRLPTALGWIAKHPIDRQAEDSYFGPSAASAAVRRDGRKFIRGVDKSITNEAADRLGDFEGPALVAWSEEDRVFPVADGEALQAALPDARLTLIQDAYTFSMEDNPGQLADRIREFLDETGAVAL